MAFGVETLRFVLLGDDRASPAFARLARTISDTTSAVDKNNLALGAQALKLESIKAQLGDLGKMKVSPKVDLSDLKTKIQLDDVQARLARLNEYVARPDISLAGLLRAQLEIDRLKAKLNDLNGIGGGGFLRNIIGSAGGAGGAGASGLLGISATLPIIGEAGPAALGALGIAAVAAAFALAPVAAALIPVTAGFGALAFIAKNQLSPVFTALGEHGKALAKTLAGMSESQKDLYRQALPLKQAFGGLAKSVQPEIYKAAGTAIKIIKDLMPALRPLVIAAAKALDTFLTEMSDWLSSPQGKSFVHWLATVGPADIRNFGRVMWDIAHTVGDALHFIYSAGSWIDKFLTHWRDDWTIVKNVFRLIGDEIVILAVDFVVKILAPFTHIPFIGHYFAAARDAARRELQSMEADARQAGQNISGAFAAIHAAPVALNFDLNLPTGIGITGPGGGKTHRRAAGGMITGGIPGRDSVLSVLMPGEVVVPADMVSSGAVDHLRGRLPGFAGGGMIGYSIRDRFVPPVGVFDRRMTAAANADIQAVDAYVRGHAKITGTLTGVGAGFAGGPAGGSAAANMAIARAMFPWPASQWPAFNAVEMREAGYSLTARNPSGAYGMAQFINGPGEYYQYGGNPNTAAGQLVAMFNYIRQRYGTPAGAWAHELSAGWYDQGGFLPPGVSIAVNNTGRPEPVGARGGDTYNINVTVKVGHGTNPRQAAKEIVDLLNQGATAGTKLRRSIVSANG